MRRNQGAGSIRERRPGVWQLRYMGQTVTVHGGRKLAEREMGQLIARTPQRRAASSRTVGALLDVWVTRHDGDTRTSYNAAIAHVPDTFKAKRVSSLDLVQFDKLYAEMSAAGVSPHTIRKAHAALSAALTEAVRWRWIGQHPARGARLPALPATRATAPSNTQVAALMAACEPGAFRVFLRLALATGARRGELLALRWRNVTHDTVTIAGSLTEQRATKVTKTNRVRSVVLDAVTLDELAAWRDVCVTRSEMAGTTIAADGYIISEHPRCAIPWRPDGVSQRFRRLCARAGVHGVRLHDLRHWHATTLLASGADVLAVSARLGHSRTSTTLDVYGHVLDGRDRIAAGMVGDALADI